MDELKKLKFENIVLKIISHFLSLILGMIAYYYLFK